MKLVQEQSQGGTSPKNKPRLSKDGKWRSFPKVPNLLQYVSSGTYFARVKIQGKIIRQSLETLDLAIESQQEQGGENIPNPAREVARAKIKPKHLKLPEPDQFRELVGYVRKQNSWGKASAELIEFLAYSGLRLYTEAQWVAWEDIDWKRNEIVIRGDPNTATKNWEIRRVPILPNMSDLLQQLTNERGEPLTGKILRITECPGTLKKACEAVGIPLLRHHDLRHLFATRWIEAGVDIPTVARWLGHKDGGALAMKTYGHLRNEHSQQMAQKVKF